MPSQLVNPTPHWVAHTRPEHTCPKLHRVPHAPQFCGSFEVFTHASPPPEGPASAPFEHGVRSSVHPRRQRPATQP